VHYPVFIIIRHGLVLAPEAHLEKNECFRKESVEWYASSRIDHVIFLAVD